MVRELEGVDMRLSSSSSWAVSAGGGGGEDKAVDADVILAVRGAKQSGPQIGWDDQPIQGPRQEKQTIWARFKNVTSPVPQTSTTKAAPPTPHLLSPNVVSCAQERKGQSGC